ncbi:transposase IS4, partial [Candidatus Magnetoovum chiemensis]
MDSGHKRALHGNPYDGHTLEEALAQTQYLTGWMPKEFYCDKGYKGAHKLVSQSNVHLTNKKRKSV